MGIDNNYTLYFCQLLFVNHKLLFFHKFVIEKQIIMRLVKIIVYTLILFTNNLLFSQATVQHWMLNSQSVSNEAVGNLYVYQSVGQLTVTNTGSVQDFLQQGFQQSNWGTIISQNSNNYTTVIFPNPFTDFLSIRFSTIPSKNLTCEIYDLQGRLVFSQQVEGAGNLIQLDLRKLVQSQFLLRIKGENYVYSQMIIKK